MLTKYYQKIKKDSEKRYAKGIKIFLKKKKTRNEKRFVKDIKIFLKKKKKKTSILSWTQ